MCSCGIDSPCYGCTCGCKHTGPVDAKPTEIRSDFSLGYAAALDEARDAVAALLGKTVPPSDGVTEALAAIDALKEES